MLNTQFGRHFNHLFLLVSVLCLPAYADDPIDILRSIDQSHAGEYNALAKKPFRTLRQKRETAKEYRQRMVSGSALPPDRVSHLLRSVRRVRAVDVDVLAIPGDVSENRLLRFEFFRDAIFLVRLEPSKVDSGAKNRINMGGQIQGVAAEQFFELSWDGQDFLSLDLRAGPRRFSIEKLALTPYYRVIEHLSGRESLADENSISIIDRFPSPPKMIQNMSLRYAECAAYYGLFELARRSIREREGFFKDPQVEEVSWIEKRELAVWLLANFVGKETAIQMMSASLDSLFATIEFDFHRVGEIQQMRPELEQLCENLQDFMPP